MDSILFFKLITTILPIIFIIAGLYLLRTQWKNKISVIFACIAILVGGIKLINTLYDYPSLTESKRYYNKLINLKASETSKILVTSKIITEEFEIKSLEITNKNQIKEILNIMDFNQSKTFEFKDWSPENTYTLECITNENEIFKFYVSESEDKRSYIDILYPKNGKFVIIGNYRNDLIKKLNILEL